MTFKCQQGIWHPGAEEDSYHFVVNDCMGGLPETRLDPTFNDAYREYDTDELDPLILDRVEVLLPLLDRIHTLDDVLHAKLSGEFESFRMSAAGRIAWGFNVAGELDQPALMAAAQSLVDEGEWSFVDCRELEEVGLVVPPDARRPEAFIEGIRRRIRDYRMRPRPSNFR